MTLLNLGCGLLTYPNEPHWSHAALLGDALPWTTGEWWNVDRNMTEGVNEQVNLFSYPWPWADDTFEGALASHLVEHIPHKPDIMSFNGCDDLMHAGAHWQQNVVEWRKRCEYLATLQDGWFVFFAELWRVLTPGARAHILCPHGHSDGAKADPTHTRYVMPQTMGYFLEGENDKQFHYELGSVWRLPQESIRYRITEMFRHLNPAPDDDPETTTQKLGELHMAMMTRINVVYEFYAPLEVVK